MSETETNQTQPGGSKMDTNKEQTLADYWKAEAASMTRASYAANDLGLYETGLKAAHKAAEMQRIARRHQLRAWGLDAEAAR